MPNYAQHYSKKVTPQSEAIPGEAQVANNAGGYTYFISPWEQFRRFLILGSEGGTYYVGERKPSRENAENVEKCIAENGIKAVDLILEISEGGLAPKPEPAIFAYALACATKDTETKRYALSNLPRICRTGTHLFTFVEYVEQFRGWGRLLKAGVAGWYLSLDTKDLAYQLIKYQQRNGWSHRDLLRLSHPLTADPERAALFDYACRGLQKEVEPAHLPERVVAAHLSRTATDAEAVAEAITMFDLPRETVNTALLNEKAIWARLAEKMPITATIRNLGKMSAVGLLSPLSEFEKKIAAKIKDPKILQKGRVHPLQIMLASSVYTQGHGDKGKLSWTPSNVIKQALQEAFYNSFQHVEPTGKRLYLGLDVSSSMFGSYIAGTKVSAGEAAGVLAMVTARTEPNHYVAGFTSGGGSSHYRTGTLMQQLQISPGDSLENITHEMQRRGFGGTDCALPMLDALQQRIPVDCFIIITDNETWAGSIHPKQALMEYRQKMGIPAKLIVMGMTATNFSIADPNDPGMLDVVGFDTSVSQIIHSFIKD